LSSSKEDLDFSLEKDKKDKKDKKDQRQCFRKV
jgi:hypothetical protein